MGEEQSEAVSYADALKGTEYENFSAEQSIETHTEHVLNKTNEIRQKINDGEYSTLSLAEVFESIHRHHMGDSQVEHIIALYDPAISIYGTTPTLQDYASDLSTRGRNHSGQIDVNGRPVGDINSIRTSELNMARAGENDIVVIGAPVNSLPLLWEKFFAKVDTAVNFYTEQDDITDDEKYAFSVAAATLLDHLHFRADGNGRSSEDWMVELQRRLFHGDMTKVRTWTNHGVRAKGLDMIKNPLLKIYPEWMPELHTRETIMQERALAVMAFRNHVADRLLVSYEENLQEETTLKNIATSLNRVMTENPEKVIDMYSSVIDSIDLSEGRIASGLEITEDSSKRGIVNTLMSSTHIPYKYDKYNIEDIFPDRLPQEMKGLVSADDLFSLTSEIMRRGGTDMVGFLKDSYNRIIEEVKGGVDSLPPNRLKAIISTIFALSGILSSNQNEYIGDFRFNWENNRLKNPNEIQNFVEGLDMIGELTEVSDSEVDEKLYKHLQWIKKRDFEGIQEILSSEFNGALSSF